MQPEVRGEVLQWLSRAERDLLGAERTLQGTEPLTDLSVFHAQQAVRLASEIVTFVRQEIGRA